MPPQKKAKTAMGSASSSIRADSITELSSLPSANSTKDSQDHVYNADGYIVDVVKKRADYVTAVFILMWNPIFESRTSDTARIGPRTHCQCHTSHPLPRLPCHQVPLYHISSHLVAENGRAWVHPSGIHKMSSPELVKMTLTASSCSCPVMVSSVLIAVQTHLCWGPAAELDDYPRSPKLRWRFFVPSYVHTTKSLPQPDDTSFWRVQHMH